jgi:hypothetical protein
LCGNGEGIFGRGLSLSLPHKLLRFEMGKRKEWSGVERRGIAMHV